jgi:hypothetical protein
MTSHDQTLLTTRRCTAFLYYSARIHTPAQRVILSMPLTFPATVGPTSRLPSRENVQSSAEPVQLRCDTASHNSMAHRNSSCCNMNLPNILLGAKPVRSARL